MPPERRHLPLFAADAHLPYSKGLMARTLMVTGLSPVRAYELARLIEGRLGDGAEHVSAEDLYKVVKEVLSEQGVPEAAEHLALLERLYELEKPLIILLGGTAGTGKSTIATEVAHRLGISRITSTDVIRQTMRAFFPEKVMPTIHHSTFRAFAGLELTDYKSSDPVLLGFLEQTSLVHVGVEAVIERAIEEGYSLVVEGVHLLPGMLPEDERAVFCPFVLVIADEHEHERRFQVRSSISQGKRPHERYVEGLEEIRRIQDYLAEKADKEGVPILETDDLEATTQRAIKGVLAKVAAATTPTPPPPAERRSLWRWLTRRRP